MSQVPYHPYQLPPLPPQLREALSSLLDLTTEEVERLWGNSGTQPTERPMPTHSMLETVKEILSESSDKRSVNETTAPTTRRHPASRMSLPPRYTWKPYITQKPLRNTVTLRNEPLQPSFIITPMLHPPVMSQPAPGRTYTTSPMLRQGDSTPSTSRLAGLGEPSEKLYKMTLLMESWPGDLPPQKWHLQWNMVTKSQPESRSTTLDVTECLIRLDDTNYHLVPLSPHPLKSETSQTEKNPQDSPPAYWGQDF
jgi:hypothetical protein